VLQRLVRAVFDFRRKGRIEGHQTGHFNNVGKHDSGVLLLAHAACKFYRPFRIEQIQDGNDDASRRLYREYRSGHFLGHRRREPQHPEESGTEDQRKYKRK
jgi:hypothetical protein